MMSFSFKSLFNFSRDSAASTKQTSPTTAESSWQSFADKHNTGLEKIAAAGMGLSAVTPVSEKIARLNYMYIHSHDRGSAVDHIKAAGKILDATVALMNDPDSSAQNALHYACEACAIILHEGINIFSTEFELLDHTVDKALTVIRSIAERDETELSNHVYDKLIELKAGMARYKQMPPMLLEKFEIC